MKTNLLKKVVKVFLRGKPTVVTDTQKGKGYQEVYFFFIGGGFGPIIFARGIFLPYAYNDVIHIIELFKRSTYQIQYTQTLRQVYIPEYSIILQEMIRGGGKRVAIHQYFPDVTLVHHTLPKDIVTVDTKIRAISFKEE